MALVDEDSVRIAAGKQQGCFHDRVEQAGARTDPSCKLRLLKQTSRSSRGGMIWGKKTAVRRFKARAVRQLPLRLTSQKPVDGGNGKSKLLLLWSLGLVDML